MIEMLLDRSPAWLDGNGSDACTVLASECSLLRNLADFAFPARCADEERHAVEQRVIRTLDVANLLASGRYYALSRSSCEPEGVESDSIESRLVTERLLAERWLAAFYEIRPALVRGVRYEAPEGVYVADDHSMSIMVNGADHLCVRVLTSGMQLLEGWARLNLLDDTLAAALGFAFDERFGYFTSDIACVGTGLKANVILHLPSLAMTNGIADAAKTAHERRQHLAGLKPVIVMPVAGGVSATVGNPKGAPRLAPPAVSDRLSEALYSDWHGRLLGQPAESEGDLYALTNAATLGLSEEEILFQLRQTAAEIAAKEQEARANLLKEDRIRIEDRVARAIGLAQSARLLDFREALAILSSIRLGIAAALVPNHSIQELNNLMIGAQSYHVRVAMANDTEELSVSNKRAELFRTRFSLN